MKVFHPCDGGPRRRTMYLATVDWAISMPSLSNSPWIRGAPHSGFSRLICRTRLRTLADSVLKSFALLVVGLLLLSVHGVALFEQLHFQIPFGGPARAGDAAQLWRPPD